jgi:hypothetical protein
VRSEEADEYKNFIFLEITYLEKTRTLPYLKVKVKESHNRSGVAQRVPGSLGFQISMTFGT